MKINTKINVYNSTKVSLIDAIKSMDTYCRLNDGILEVIKETVVDPEVVTIYCNY